MIRHMHGAVLSRQEILESHVIAELESADDSCLRPAGYDVRVGARVIAADGRILNLPDAPLNGSLILDPGESAVIQTHETLRLPERIAANVTLKTGVAANGVLLLSGMLVDPTYTGHLHLVIANLGSRPYPLVHNRPIASVQFLHVSGHHPADGVPPASSLAKLFEKDGTTEPPVAFLEDLRALRQEFNQLQRDTQRTSDQAQTVIALGVILVTATLFGVVADFALSFALNSNLVNAVKNAAPSSLAGKALIALTILCVTYILRLVFRFAERELRLRRGGEADQQGHPATQPSVEATGQKWAR